MGAHRVTGIARPGFGRLLRSLRNRVGALGELRGPDELLLLARIVAFAAIVPGLLRLPLPLMARLVTRPVRPAPPGGSEPERLGRMVELARRVGAPAVRAGCLTRGLTLFWFLRRAGVDVELRFGLELDPADPALETDGHCWIARAGEPFLEPRDPRERFVELYRLPLTGSITVPAGIRA